MVANAFTRKEPTIQVKYARMGVTSKLADLIREAQVKADKFEKKMKNEGIKGYISLLESHTKGLRTLMGRI